MRLESFPVNFNLPTGRTVEGDIVYSRYERDLAPEGRQLDVTTSYRWASPDGSATAMAGVAHSFNENHEPGKSETSVAAWLGLKF